MMKRKWRSAEEKKQAEELARSWEELMLRHKTTAVKVTKPLAKQERVFRRETIRHPSHGMDGSATKPVDSLSYTGTAMLGIGTLHKSNAVPIFNSDAAK